MSKNNLVKKQKIAVGRFVIPYRIYGDKGPHLICLNGAQQSMAMWLSFVRQFSSNYRIVLFDFPNQGKAQALEGDTNATTDEQVDILYNILKVSEVDKHVTICTASWGGIVALLFAVKHPQLVRRLILASIGTKPNRKMIETIKKGISMNTKDRGEMAKVLIESFGQNLPPVIKKQITTQFRTMSEDKLRSFCEHGLFVLSAENLTRIVDLKKVKAETTIIRGERDTIIDSEDVYFLASKIPNCKIKVVEDIGHFMHLENEEIFNVYREVLEVK